MRASFVPPHRMGAIEWIGFDRTHPRRDGRDRPDEVAGLTDLAHTRAINAAERILAARRFGVLRLCAACGELHRGRCEESVG